MKSLSQNHLNLKLSLILLTSFLWGCGTAVAPGDLITLEYEGPVTVSYYAKDQNTDVTLQNPPSHPSTLNISEETTFVLQNLGNDVTAGYFTKRLIGGGSEGDAILELYPGRNANWIQANIPNTDATAAGKMSWDHAAASDYKLKNGQNAPVDIFSNIPIGISGSALSKAIYHKAADDSDTEISTEKVNEVIGNQALNQMWSDQNQGPITLVVKFVAPTGKKETTGPGTTLPGGTSHGTTAVTPTENKAGGGSSCMQLAPDSTSPTTGWVWLAAIGVTAWIAGRRIRVRCR